MISANASSNGYKGGINKRDNSKLKTEKKIRDLALVRAQCSIRVNAMYEIVRKVQPIAMHYWFMMNHHASAAVVVAKHQGGAGNRSVPVPVPASAAAPAPKKQESTSK